MGRPAGTSFPYEFREGQREVYEEVRRAVEGGGRAICLQAPTGFGKTPVVLSALLDAGARILWLVRTGTETDRPVEELRAINEAAGAGHLGMSFRGKRDMCLLARDAVKDGSDMDYEEASFFCRKNRGRCPYYAGLRRAPEPSGPMLYSEILEAGRAEGFCPYYYQREAAPHMRLISASYNYVISEAVSWALRGVVDFHRMYLVVDEAHNLQFAPMNLNSDSITSGSISRAKEEARGLGLGRLEGALDSLEAAARWALGRRKEARVDFGGLIARAGISEEDIELIRSAGERIRLKRLQSGERPRSSLWHIYRFISESRGLEGVEGVAFFVRREKDGIELERLDMRAAEVLSRIWGQFRGVLFMSGTLEPMDAFAEVVGVAGCREVRADFRVRAENVKTYLITGISTRGERMNEGMRSRYLRVLLKFLSAFSDRNVAVFSSSYRIQEELLRGLPEEFSRRAYVEREGMSGDESRRILEAFKAASRSSEKGILFASASGRFAEGADFPGKELEAAMVVGIPFDRPTLRVRAYVEYYSKLYGEERGRYLAYVVPALRRAAQALGRVIRSEEDRGTFVLADSRYARREYFELLPSFVKANVEAMSYEEFLSAEL